MYPLQKQKHPPIWKYPHELKINAWATLSDGCYPNWTPKRLFLSFPVGSPCCTIAEEGKSIPSAVFRCCTAMNMLPMFPTLSRIFCCRQSKWRNLFLIKRYSTEANVADSKTEKKKWHLLEISNLIFNLFLSLLLPISTLLTTDSQHIFFLLLKTWLSIQFTCDILNAFNTMPTPLCYKLLIFVMNPHVHFSSCSGTSSYSRVSFLSDCDILESFPQAAISIDKRVWNSIHK